MNQSPPSSTTTAARLSPPLLVASGLAKKFAGRLVLSWIDLTLAPGEIVHLLGANGAGKTTLLHCLGGRQPPSAGELYWLGESPQRRPDLRRHVGLATHEAALYPELTAHENLLFAARMSGLSQPLEHVARMFAALRLFPELDQPAGRLSQGLRQRIALGRAVIHRPAIVLFDEPFSSLDADGREWLVEWLRELRAQGCAILFSEHDERLAGRIADRQVELQRGALRRRVFVAPRDAASSAAAIAPGSQVA